MFDDSLRGYVPRHRKAPETILRRIEQDEHL